MRAKSAIASAFPLRRRRRREDLVHRVCGCSLKLFMRINGAGFAQNAVSDGMPVYERIRKSGKYDDAHLQGGCTQRVG
jgi:hypothetical protein